MKFGQLTSYTLLQYIVTSRNILLILRTFYVKACLKCSVFLMLLTRLLYTHCCDTSFGAQGGVSAKCSLHYYDNRNTVSAAVLQSRTAFLMVPVCSLYVIKTTITDTISHLYLLFKSTVSRFYNTSETHAKQYLLC